jgi:hypothetical protein
VGRKAETLKGWKAERGGSQGLDSLEALEERDSPQMDTDVLSLGLAAARTWSMTATAG